MATDWRELDRGVVVGSTSRNVYNGNPGGQRASYYVVQRADGTTFEAYKPDVMRGTADMQRYTDNPNEDLTNKLVYPI